MSSLRRRLPVPLLKPSSLLWRGTFFHSTYYHLWLSLLSTVYLPPPPQPDSKLHGLVTTVFLFWVWYYRTASDTKWVVQELFLKWVNSNEGISSQGQQTKYWLEGKRCWAWKPFLGKHFLAPWSLWSYFSLCVLSFSPTINDSIKDNLWKTSLWEGTKM